MKVLVLGATDSVAGHLAAPLGQRLRRHRRRQPQSSRDRPRARVESLTPIRPMVTNCTWKELTGKTLASSTSTSPKSMSGSSSYCATSVPTRLCISVSSARRRIHAQRRASVTRSTTTCEHPQRSRRHRGERSRHCLVHSHHGRLRLRWSGSRRSPRLPHREGTHSDGEIEREILHPANPARVSHDQDARQLLFAFYAKNDNCASPTSTRASCGNATPQTVLDERLINRFDYDGDYGTC